MYLVIFNDTGLRHRVGFSPWGEVISRHRTISGALRSFRRRNRHLYDNKYAQSMGMGNCGTFDEIVEVDRDGLYVGPVNDWEEDI